MEQRRRSVSSSKKVPSSLRWVAAVVAGAFVFLLLVWLVIYAPQYFVRSPSEADLRKVDAAKRLELQNDVRTTLLQGLGGLAVLAGAAFAYGQLLTNRRQLQHSIESSQQQQELDRQGQVTERFTRAIDQLGHENPDVRLGGIYALERIAKDSPQDRASIAEILAAFVRNHAPWPPNRPGQPGDDWPSEDIPPMWEWAPEAQAALTVLGRQEPPIDLRQPLDLRRTDLRRADLIDAQLPEVDFEGAQLWSADLRGARLRKANFFEADLHGADLEGAVLQGASFAVAELDDANLERAQLQGADLRGFVQGANLRNAQLQGANLKGSRLQGARYNNKTVWPDGFDYEAAEAKLKED